MQSPTPIVYDEVVIRFSRQFYYSDSDTYQATIRTAHTPVKGGAFQLDMSKALEDFLELFAIRTELAAKAKHEPDAKPHIKTAREEAPKQSSQELGIEFFKLLPESLQKDFRLLFQSAIDRHHGIRLVLEASALDPATRLLVLPWELVFSEARLGYFGQSQRLVIVRRLIDTVRRDALQLSPTFRVLHAVAVMPNDAKREQIEALGVAEQAAMEEIIGGERYKGIAPRTSIEDIDNYLTPDNSYSIFHFTGHGNDYENLPHGGPTGSNQRSFLTFVADGTNRQAISGERLRYTLNKGNTQVVMLNACHGGTPTMGNAAMELVYGGTPYVVAMQGEISVAAAEVFSKAFYQALKGEEPIEVAVAAGREQIAITLPTTLDWALPTLYTVVGVRTPALSVVIANTLSFWFAVLGRQWLVPTHLVGGILLLFLSLLLAVSRVQPTLPDPLSLLVLVGWTVLIPIVITVYTYYVQLKGRNTKDTVVDAQTFQQIMESALIGFGMGMYFTWVGCLLAVATGLWVLLTPIAHFLFLVPFLLGSTLLCHSQAYGYGNTVIDSRRLKGPRSSFFLPVAFISLFIFLYGPIAIVWREPFWATPPVSTFVVGVLWLVLAYALKRDDDAKERSR